MITPLFFSRPCGPGAQTPPAEVHSQIPSVRSVPLQKRHSGELGPLGPFLWLWASTVGGLSSLSAGGWGRGWKDLGAGPKCWAGLGVVPARLALSVSSLFSGAECRLALWPPGPTPNQFRMRMSPSAWTAFSQRLDSAWTEAVKHRSNARKHGQRTAVRKCTCVAVS